MSTTYVKTCDSCGATRAEEGKDEWVEIYGLPRRLSDASNRDFCPRCFPSVAEALKCAAPSSGNLEAALAEVEALRQTIAAQSKAVVELMAELNEVAAENVRLTQLRAADAHALRKAVRHIECLLGYLGKKALNKFAVEVAEIESEWQDHFPDPDSEAILRRWIHPEDD